MSQQDMNNTRQQNTTVGDSSSPWAAEIDDLRQRQAWAKLHGGKENVKRHQELGKLPARSRIDKLLDTQSFREIGSITGQVSYDANGKAQQMLPSNSIVGTGKIQQRRVIVSADDFTVRGGSSEASIAEKWIFAERWAIENKVPLIRLVDAAGGSIRLLEKLQSTKIPGYSTWLPAQLLSEVPVVGVALGPCAGLGAAKVAFSHFSIMVEDTSQIFAGGPHVVAPGIGQTIDKETLGGHKVHARGSGVVDNVVSTEEDALQQVRDFLSYLPPNVHDVPPVSEIRSPELPSSTLNSIIPRNRRTPYNPRKVLASILDAGSLFEIGKYWGRASITALGRINGRPAGIMINDPMRFGGSVTADAAEKVTRFIDVCEMFNLPLINLVDQPGVYVGEQAERSGTIRHALRLMSTIEQVKVPWATFILRRAFGIGGGLHSPLSRPIIKYAWPSAHWGSIPVEGGVEAAFRRDIQSSSDPARRKEELLAQYRAYESPFRTAERFGVEEIIEPSDTVQILQEWIVDAYERLPHLTGKLTRTFRG